MEFLVPVSNGYLYQHRVGEMGDNVKRQDGDDRMLLTSLFKFIMLHVL